MTNDELDSLVARLRHLSIAVMADRLYILGSDQFADYELVARWSAEVTPGTILQLLNTIAALRSNLEAAKKLLIEGKEWIPSHFYVAGRIDAFLAKERQK
jgi:hypothetical protein